MRSYAIAAMIIFSLVTTAPVASATECTDVDLEECREFVFETGQMAIDFICVNWNSDVELPFCPPRT